MKKSISVLNFGGQYAHLIASQFRKLGYYSQVYPNDIYPERLKNSKGIVLSGGGDSVNKDKYPDFDDRIFDLKLPILGICFGHQILAKKLGGEVKKAKNPEYGETILILNKDNKLFQNAYKKGEKVKVWMSHWDEVSKMPNGFQDLASTKNSKNAAIFSKERNLYSVQFHPEVTHTKNGKIILDNFARKICKMEKNWNIDEYIELEKYKIKKQLGDKKVFHLVSGGVDSTVSFALLSKILGAKRVFALFIDTGLLRLKESEEFK